MIVYFNNIPINRCNIVGFAPREVSESFDMLSGNRRYDVIEQFEWPMQISYDLIKSDDFEVIRQIWKTMAAVSVRFTDWNGVEVSFSAKMSPPQMVRKRILSDGQWLFGQCTFTLDQL